MLIVILYVFVNCNTCILITVCKKFTRLHFSSRLPGESWLASFRWLSFFTVSGRVPLGINGTGFHGPAVPRVTPPTVSKH